MLCLIEKVDLWVDLLYAMLQYKSCIVEIDIYIHKSFSPEKTPPDLHGISCLEIIIIFHRKRKTQNLIPSLRSSGRSTMKEGTGNRCITVRKNESCCSVLAVRRREWISPYLLFVNFGLYIMQLGCRRGEVGRACDAGWDPATRFTSYCWWSSTSCRWYPSTAA